MYNKVETNMNFVDREKQTEKFWKIMTSSKINGTAQTGRDLHIL